MRRRTGRCWFIRTLLILYANLTAQLIADLRDLHRPNMVYLYTKQC